MDPMGYNWGDLPPFIPVAFFESAIAAKKPGGSDRQIRPVVIGLSQRLSHACLSF